MGNPYLLEEPFVVSFSGGRTSAYMTTMVGDVGELLSVLSL